MNLLHICSRENLLLFPFNYKEKQQDCEVRKKLGIPTEQEVSSQM